MDVKRGCFEIDQLLVWDSDMFRKVFAPVQENGVWRIRNNNKIMQKIRKTDTVRYKIKPLRCLGDILKLKENYEKDI